MTLVPNFRFVSFRLRQTLLNNKRPASTKPNSKTKLLEGAELVLDRYFGPHAVPLLEYNLVLSQSDKLRDLEEGLGRNVQILNGPVLTPPVPVPALGR